MASEERLQKDKILVREYRERLNDLESAQHDGVSGRDLQRRLDEVGDLYSRCDLPGPQVAEVDGRLVAELSDQLYRGVRGVGGTGKFQPSDFAARLVDVVGQAESLTPGAWTGLGRLTSPVLSPCPGLHVLLGRLGVPNAPAPERKPRAPRTRPSPLAAAVAPDQVVGTADATPQQINRLELALKKLYARFQKPISFFEFAYDPTDFGLTVENVFHTSILVKMGKARVYLMNGLPFIEPIVAGTATGPATDEKHQVLVKIDHDTWKQVVQQFGIRKSLIPRADGAQRGARRADGALEAAPQAKRQ